MLLERPSKERAQGNRWLRSPARPRPALPPLACILSLSIALVCPLSGCLAKDGGAVLPPIGIAQSPTSDLTAVIERKGKLTLEAYLRAVDENYPELKAADRQRQIASAIRTETRGPFDPLFSNVSGMTRMQNTSKIGVPKYALFNDPKLEVLLRSGARVWAQYRFNPQTSQSPYVETGSGGEYSAGVSVPLMRDLIINPESAAEMKAKLGEKLAGEIYALTRLDTLLKAGTIYWTWVASKQRTDVQDEIARLSKLLLSISADQEKVGDLARIFVSEAEEDVARRDADFIQATRDFQHVSFMLSILLFNLGGMPIPTPTAVNVPDEIHRPAPYLETETRRNIEIALGKRPELKQINFEREIAKVELRLAKNQILPLMNATYSEGYDTGFRGIGHVFRGQITLSEPMWQHAARGKMQAAKLRIEKLNREEQAVQQKIRNEVLDAISAINLAYERFLKVEQQVRKADEVYLGERERFRAGDSTVFLVTQRERQLTEARLKLIDAEVEYQVGVVALRILTCAI